VYRKNAKGRFRAVRRLNGVDNLRGFMELATSTMSNYQPERFNIKTQRALPKIEDIRLAPGIYKGLSMHSQGEIAFATELDARRIRWKYEPEALGKAGYVVDFYLPELRAWVDTRRWKLSPKEETVLKSTAATLTKERSERLFVFMPENVLLVTPKEITTMTQDEFWFKVVRP
jgi:hypothetical protein